MVQVVPPPPVVLPPVVVPPVVVPPVVVPPVVVPPVVVPPVVPPDPPAYCMNVSVNARLFWLIWVQVDRELALPLQGWSRLTDQNASRPTPCWAAKLSTVWASARVNVE